MFADSGYATVIDLRGEGEEAHEAVVALNAGALAWVFGKAVDLRTGTDLALEALRSGRCIERLERFAENRP